MNRYKPVGWRNESLRHSLAAKGLTRKAFLGKKSQIIDKYGGVPDSKTINDAIVESKFKQNCYDLERSRCIEDSVRGKEWSAKDIDDLRIMKDDVLKTDKDIIELFRLRREAKKQIGKKNESL